MSQSSTHTQSSIARHRRSHNGDKPYTCTYCDAAYADKKRLQEHILSHTGDRPYKCKFCKFRSKRCVLPSLTPIWICPSALETNKLLVIAGRRTSATTGSDTTRGTPRTLVSTPAPSRPRQRRLLPRRRRRHSLRRKRIGQWRAAAFPGLRVAAVNRTPTAPPPPTAIGIRPLTTRGGRGAAQRPRQPPTTTLTLSGTSTRTAASSPVSEKNTRKSSLLLLCKTDSNYFIFQWLRRHPRPRRRRRRRRELHRRPRQQTPWWPFRSKSSPTTPRLVTWR